MSSPPGRGGLLQHSDGVAPPVEIVGRRQPRRPGAHHCDGFSRPLVRRAGAQVSPGEGLLDDGQLIVPDGHRLAKGPADAGLLTGSRARPAGEFRKAIGLQQPGQGLAAVAPPEHVVPLRDPVVQRTTQPGPLIPHPGLAEGHTAVHAPAGLFPPGLRRQGLSKGGKIFYPLQGRPLRAGHPGVVPESCDLSHSYAPRFRRSKKAASSAASRSIPWA